MGEEDREGKRKEEEGISGSSQSGSYQTECVSWVCVCVDTGGSVWGRPISSCSSAWLCGCVTQEERGSLLYYTHMLRAELHSLLMTRK